MSTEYQDSEGDLIDLHVKSPVLPRASPHLVSFPEISDNLIDTELPILEQKLQTASKSVPPRSNSRRTSVDIEDILITIDDEDEVDAPNKISEQFHDLCDSNTEALNVLRNLDDVLNASLLESDSILDEIEEANSFQTQQDLEDCLQDLDNYLKAIDCSSCDEFSDGSNLSVCADDHSTDTGSTNVAGNHGLAADGFEGESESIDEENLRNKLRQMEENYTKFLASGFINRGYVDTEASDSDRRPLSACGAVNEAQNKNHPARATVAVVSRERPSLRRMEDCIKSRCRTSGPVGDSDEQIYAIRGGSQDVENNVNLERRAHAAGDCCTGTVVVELPRTSTNPSSSSEPTMNEEPKYDTHSNNWLRNSMRRLRHLRLPSGEASIETNDIEVGQQILEPDPSRLHVSTLTTANRPVSAPSRLPTRTPSRNSRSRSRESHQSAVSHEPGGRARSSSASSRSRRPRSLSSSESSIPSSVDSTPSCTTAATPTQNAQQTNGSPNRYTFLIAGFLYGGARKRALEIIEDGRKEEKERLRAERNAALQEEKKAAAEKDVTEIATLFGVHDITKYQPTNVQNPNRYTGKPLHYEPIWSENNMQDFDNLTRTINTTEDFDSIKSEDKDEENFNISNESETILKGE